MVLNSSSFFVSVELSLLQIWMITLLGRVFLVLDFSLSSLWMYLATPFWPIKVSSEKLAHSLMGILLYQPTFLLLLLRFLTFSFCYSIIRCFGVHFGGFILFGTFCASWTCTSVSFSSLGNVSFISSNKFSAYYSLFLLWDP